MKDMLGREELITVEQAMDLLFRAGPFRSTKEINLPLEDCYGLITSREIVSPEDLPFFHRSTVDGFAVDSSQTFGATENIPSYMLVKAEILMGEKPNIVLQKGEVARISTGGMLPDGADAVVMIEHTQAIDDNTIEIGKALSPGENVIHSGEDVHKGASLLKKRKRLRPQDIGALAGVGITDIWVYEKPKVGIISTGDEVVPSEKSLQPGQVRDINSFTLSGLVMEAGGIPQKRGIFRDDYQMIRNIVEDALNNSEMVLISGGSSVGAQDMTERVINDLGKPGVLFHGVSLKPGKPMIGGVIDGIPVFGLPGHPAAVSVCFEIFIRPVLHAQSGLIKSGFENRGRIIQARIAKNISSGPGREEHIGVSLEDRNGEIWAVPLLGKSGLITTLTKADGTAKIPLNALGVQAGEIVEIRLF
jgi:molybdopterin molybdotransferase